MERFKLLVSLFLAQNHGRKLSEIFGVKFDVDYEWIVDIGREGVSVRVQSYETTNNVTIESHMWCCVYVDDTKKNLRGENILEFWWSGRSNSCCVNYYCGKTNDTVDIENYISLEDKI